MSRYFSGQGRLYVGDYPTPNYLPVGNCSMFRFSPVDLDSLRTMLDANSQASDILPNRQGDQAFQATIDEITADNLAMLLGGTNSTVNATSGQVQLFTSK